MSIFATGCGLFVDAWYDMYVSTVVSASGTQNEPGNLAAARRSNGTDSVLRRSYVESSIILEFVIQIAYVGSTTDRITGCGSWSILA